MQSRRAERRWFAVLVVIAAHFLLAAFLPPLATRWGRKVFFVAALAPLASLVFALSKAQSVLEGPQPTETLSWAPSIGLEIALRLDSLALLMIVLVSGIGSLVLCYYASYAKPSASGVGRDSALLVTFAGSMLGLVLADDVFALYVFWELTTVCSFLLVGGDGATRASRRSATQALLVTGFGGLAMLLGLILLGTAAGTFQISEILARAPSGTLVNVAIGLLLLGAFTKSAQVPFHPWLPAAMVAPTPISAYLHAAAMVKAGVYLVARFAPGFSALPAWWIPVAVLGVYTMVLGGLRALREHDLKKLLAFGTVSQLGFLMVLVGIGGQNAAIAGSTLILAHGLFKSTLFLTVGVIDKRTGTRDIRTLSGLGRRWPALAGFAILAGGSMAGLPPLLGFAGKEAAFAALGGGGSRDLVILVGIVLGSMLTVAYTLRFLIGAFGSRPGLDPIVAPLPGPGLGIPVALPAAAGLVLALFITPVRALVEDYAAAYPTSSHPYQLALWHGLTVPLLLSALALLGGYVIHRVSARFVLPTPVPAGLSAQGGYRGIVQGLDALALAVTGRLHAGSLPTYIGIILLTMVLVPGAGLLAGVGWPEQLRLWDSPLQGLLAIVALVGCATAVLARRRLTAVVLVGVVGYSIGALFLVDGGTDLALAQFLVESLTLVVFVFVLRRFPPQFLHGKPPVRRRRWIKAVIASVAGVFVAGIAVVFSGNRAELGEASRGYIDRAQEDAGATNVVNSIIVDFRAFDTVGEISVLAVAATGAASLILAAHRARRRPEVPSPETGQADEQARGGSSEVSP